MYILLDTFHMDYIRHKNSRKIRKFKTPDDALEYAQDVLNDFSVEVRDEDGCPVDGW